MGAVYLADGSASRDARARRASEYFEIHLRFADGDAEPTPPPGSRSIDAGAAKMTHPNKNERKRTSEENHARPSKENFALPVDRGD